MRKQSVRQQLAIVEAIAQARQDAGISQRKLSVRLQEGPLFMHRIEIGGPGIGVAEFIAIARAISIDPCDLLRRSLV